MIYTYKCKKCDNEFDITHGMNEEVEVICPICNSKAKKKIIAPAIKFNGSGFYKTDYAKKL